MSGSWPVYTRQRETGIEGGAELLLDGRRVLPGDEPDGFTGDAKHGLYATPRIFDKVKIDMRIAQEECFGPTVNLIEVDGMDEAMAVANGTPYGLSSALYTRDARAMLRFKEEISAGMTSINNSTTGAEAHLPFGGNGWSGNGTRESGIWVLDAYTRWQAVNVDLSGQIAESADRHHREQLAARGRSGGDFASATLGFTYPRRARRLNARAAARHLGSPTRA